MTSQSPPMEWHRLLSATRMDTRVVDEEQARTPYHKDFDRIIFSRSFRQLNRKTQVHPLTKTDGIHTRLTHSLEVSSIGRSLGMRVAEKLSTMPKHITPADVGAIMQAACLAHDIGNPPFGHAGEFAIQDWFKQTKSQELLASLTPEQAVDIMSYEGNANGLRILTRLEYYQNKGGMRLTAATLGSFMKYPWASMHAHAHPKHKFGCYVSEKAILQQLADHLGLIQTADYCYRRHPLAYLVEAADDICYALIDLEDGLVLRMLTLDEVLPIFESLAGKQVDAKRKYQEPSHHLIAAFRGMAMNRLVEAVSETFVKHEQDLLTGQLVGSLLDHCDHTISHTIESAKAIASSKIFSHPEKAGLELLAHTSLQTILSHFMPLAIPGNSLSHLQQQYSYLLKHYDVVLGDCSYDNMMAILDRMTILSDDQAYALSQELMGNKHFKQ